MKGRGWTLLAGLLAGVMGCVESPDPNRVPGWQELPDGPAAWDEARRPLVAGDGAIELFFTRPGVDALSGEDPELDDAVAALFDSAVERIDLCVFEFDRQEIVDALLAAHARGVEIRFVGDGDELHDDGYEQLVAAGIDLSLRNPRDRIMHNKFAVVDETWVWTGSTNFSENGVLRNNNNSMSIASPELAAIYTAEFEQMYVDGLFGRRKDPVASGTEIVLGNEVLRPFFSPADEIHNELLALLDQAQYSVFFNIFSFTRADIVDRLIELHESGVLVVGIFDESQGRGRYSVDERLALAGVPVFIDGNRNSIGFAGGKLHHKTMLIDAGTDSRPTVITGSYNWSNNASHYNDENLLAIEGTELSTGFLEEFCQLLEVATPHPDYAGEAPDPCAALLVEVRINELLPNPDGADAGNEWIELVNVGPTPADLSGWTVSDRTRVRHTFTDEVLAPGDVMVLADGDATLHPGLVLSEGSLSLTNTRDTIVLRDAEGAVMDQVGYQQAPAGVSFNRADDGATAGDFIRHDSLAAADTSPGFRADGRPWGGVLLINEVMPNPDGPEGTDEWVELVNVGVRSMNLAGWTLGDRVDPERHIFGPLILAPGEGVVLFGGGSHPEVPGHLVASSGGLSLNNTGEDVTLYDAGGAIRSTTSWTSARSGISLNRELDGDPDAALVDHDTLALESSSPGTRIDGAPWGGHVIINEALPNPDGADAGNEWVELVNLDAFPVDMSGWSLGDAVQAERHVFFGLVLAPGESVVVYDSEVPGGEYASSGSLSLNNSGELLELRDASGLVRSALGWSASRSGVSLNRAIDGDGETVAVDHDTVAGAVGTTSPGTRADGSPWLP